MIELANVTKRYNDTTVVNSLNLKIEAGEIVGVIGHNGAGKSTTMKMIAGLVEPTSGSIRVMGTGHSERGASRSRGKSATCPKRVRCTRR